MPDQLRCFSCGATWVQRQANPPIRCPRCQNRKWYQPRTERPLSEPAIQHLMADLKTTETAPTNPLDILGPLIPFPPDTDPGPLPEKENA